MTITSHNDNVQNNMRYGTVIKGPFVKSMNSLVSLKCICNLYMTLTLRA